MQSRTFEKKLAPTFVLLCIGNHIPITSLHQVIQYIEQHLREELTIQEIAQQASLSPFYIQKGFAMLCGMMVGDYIHQRRLSAAGLEVLTTDRNIIDIAL